MKKYENEAMFRDTFLIHTKWRDSIKGLTQEQKGQLFKMMLNFHCGINPQASDYAIDIRPFIDQFKIDAKKYDKRKKQKLG